MKVSLEWISDYLDLPAGVTAAQLAHDLTLKTVEVEDVVTVDGDVVLEIDNKSLTNRPDLWGHYGIARELAAIYRVPLRSLSPAPRPTTVADLVGDLDPSLCRRMAAVTFTLDLSDIVAPQWLRDRLARIGESSVNLCVDLSNYVMFSVGQPTHVYDADQVATPLSVRPAGAPMKLELLTGVEQEISATTPMIWDRHGVVGIAGIMGGAASAVRPDTRSFMVEVAAFQPAPIRRASQQLGLRTEASARFEKGIDTQRVDTAIDLFLNLLTQIAPKAQIHAVANICVEETTSAVVEVEPHFLATRIGMVFDRTEVDRTLRSLGFDVSGDGELLHVVAPTWRSTGDISLPHDIVEEIARIHGYDNLPTEPLSVPLTSVRSLKRRPVDRVVREELAHRAGLQEVVTYPWVTDASLAAVGLDKATTIRFDGAPAPDRDSLRPSILPNLLDAVAANLRYRPTVEIFEVGTVFIPQERTMLGVALAGDDGAALFRHAKAVIELMARCGQMHDLGFTVGGSAEWADRAARTAIMSSGHVVGTLGLLTPRVRREIGISTAQVACVELDLSAMTLNASRENRYEPLAELPEKEFDLSVVLADAVPWIDLEAAAASANLLVHRVDYIDEFRGSWVPAGHRSVSLRVTLRPKEVTLTAETIGAVRTDVLEVLRVHTGARLRD